MHLTCKTSTFVSSAEGTRYELVQGGCFSPARGSRAGAVRWFSWMAGEFHTTDPLLALLTLQRLSSLRTTLKTDRFSLTWQLAVLTGFAFAGLQKAFIQTYPPCLERPSPFRPALRHSICVAILWSLHRRGFKMVFASGLSSTAEEATEAAALAIHCT